MLFVCLLLLGHSGGRWVSECPCSFRSADAFVAFCFVCRATREKNALTSANAFSLRSSGCTRNGFVGSRASEMHCMQVGLCRFCVWVCVFPASLSCLIWSEWRGKKKKNRKESSSSGRKKRGPVAWRRQCQLHSAHSTGRRRRKSSSFSLCVCVFVCLSTCTTSRLVEEEEKNFF